MLFHSASSAVVWQLPRLSHICVCVLSDLKKYDWGLWNITSRLRNDFKGRNTELDSNYSYESRWVSSASLQCLLTDWLTLTHILTARWRLCLSTFCLFVSPISPFSARRYITPFMSVKRKQKRQMVWCIIVHLRKGITKVNAHVCFFTTIQVSTEETTL